MLFISAVTAAINRGKAAGLYVDRKELTVNKTSDMTKLDIIKRIQELHQESGGILPIPTSYSVEAVESSPKDDVLETTSESDESND